jgi:hypothetical protein
MKRTVFVILSLMGVAAVGALAKDNIPGDVVSLLQKRCAVCHKGKTPPRGLSWESAQIAAAIDRPSREVPELKIIDGTSPEASYVLKKVRGDAGIKGNRMPPGKALGADEIKILETWILGLKRISVPASAAGSPGDPGS